jgi:quinol monooxygenase YgiN
MPVASITRLRLRKARYIPAFILSAVRCLRQARRSEGCLAADVRREKQLVFWTRTMWRDADAMRDYISCGAHRDALPKIKEWCDEASVVQWEQAGESLPGWTEALTQMRAAGRIFRVKYPSQAQIQGETVPLA